MPHVSQIRSSLLPVRRDVLRRSAIILTFFITFGGLSTSRVESAAKAPSGLKESFERGYFQVIGKSAQGQSRYRAIRSAEVTAQRELLGIIQRIRLYGLTAMEDAFSRQVVSGFLRGAVKCGQSYDADEGSAQVCLKLNLYGSEGLYENILPFIKDPKNRPPKMEPSRPVRGLKYVETQRALPGDGLILDVRGHDFMPALLNRILTESNHPVFGDG